MNKNKFYKYKVFINYYDNPFHDKEFIVWGYSETNIINLICCKINLYPSQLRAIAHIQIYRYPIYSFFARLFNKVPKEPICTEV